MNNKFTKKVLILVSSLMAQAVFSNIVYSADALSRLSTYREVVGADANMTDRYALPPNKINIEPCQRAALLLHPGVLEKQRILHRHEGFWMRYEIEAHGDSEWFVLCDLATGKIIREQKLDDDVF